MYKRLVPSINEQIKKTKRAIISLGCSFVQGQGAVDDVMYTDYKWTYEKIGIPLKLNVDKIVRKEIIQRFPSVRLDPTGELDFTFMEYKNAFVQVLAEKYFENSYAAINLGRRGNGNRSSIKDLYLIPEIKLNECDEIIVIYCPSGPERFDFINDEGIDHHRWRTMWPNYKDVEERNLYRRMLWEGYSKYLYSEKSTIIEQIVNVQELMLWCNYHNAKLIITPSFDYRYSRSYFKDELSNNYVRHGDGTIMNIVKDKKSDDLKYLDMWPWDMMFKPEGHETFMDLVMSKEYPGETEFHHFFDFLGTGSPNGWVTSCAHPSAKGHDLFAKTLFNYIQESR